APIHPRRRATLYPSEPGCYTFASMSAPEAAAAIEYRNVSYLAPQGRAILSGLDLRVNNGETLVLLGRSGSGKTTAIKLVNRLLEPASGEVRVQGRSTLAWDAIRLRRSIG